MLRNRNILRILNTVTPKRYISSSLTGKNLDLTKIPDEELTGHKLKLMEKERNSLNTKMKESLLKFSILAELKKITPVYDKDIDQVKDNIKKLEERRDQLEETINRFTF